MPLNQGTMTVASFYWHELNMSHVKYFEQWSQDPG